MAPALAWRGPSPDDRARVPVKVPVNVPEPPVAVLETVVTEGPANPPNRGTEAIWFCTSTDVRERISVFNDARDASISSLVSPGVDMMRSMVVRADSLCELERSGDSGITATVDVAL